MNAPRIPRPARRAARGPLPRLAIVRAYGERVPVVLLSALASDEDIARGYHEGASHDLTKPCEPRRVLNILDYLVGDLDPRQRADLETKL